MILKLSVNTEMIWMVIIKMLKNNIQIDHVRFLLFCFFDDMITVTFSNKKKLNPVVAELFIGSGK